MLEVNEDGVLGTPPVAQPPNLLGTELVVPPRLSRVSDLSSRTGGSIRPTNPPIGSGRPGQAINPLAASSVEELFAELERRNVPLDFASAASRSSLSSAAVSRSMSSFATASSAAASRSSSSFVTARSISRGFGANSSRSRSSRNGAAARSSRNGAAARSISRGFGASSSRSSSSRNGAVDSADVLPMNVRKRPPELGNAPAPAPAAAAPAAAAPAPAAAAAAAPAADSSGSDYESDDSLSSPFYSRKQCSGSTSTPVKTEEDSRPQEAIDQDEQLARAVEMEENTVSIRLPCNSIFLLDSFLSFFWTHHN